MSIIDCTIYEYTPNDEPVQAHCEGDDDPIVAAALRRQGMAFCSERGWYWPEPEAESEADDFDALLDAMHSGAGPMYESDDSEATALEPWEDEPGYMESTRPYLF